MDILADFYLTINVGVYLFRIICLEAVPRERPLNCP